LAENLVRLMDRDRGPRAALVTGSAGAGIADGHSDLDLIVYYDEVPAGAVVRDWFHALGAPPIEPQAGDHGVSVTVTFEDVECQIGALRASVVDAWISRLLSGEDPGAVHLQKVADGILNGLVLRDDGLIAGWRGRLEIFPDALAESMAAHHLAAITPYWRYQAQLSHRDAALWETRELVEDALHIVGALSAANRRYFTSFQFKRMRQHLALFDAAPDRLSERLESLLSSERAAAAADLRALVRETVEVVERLLPEVDTETARRDLGEWRR
jgi:hypothetical protein